MIKVSMIKDGHQVVVTADHKGFSRQSGKKRLTRTWQTQTNNPDEATELLAKAVQRETENGYAITSIEGIEKTTLDALITSLVANATTPVHDELVTVALANDSSRDRLIQDLPKLVDLIGLSYQKQTALVCDPQDASSIYFLTMHSGSAKLGSKMEVFLAAVAWKFQRQLIHGIAIRKSQDVFSRIDADMVDALAEMGYAPKQLQFRAAATVANLMW